MPLTGEWMLPVNDQHLFVGEHRLEPQAGFVQWIGHDQQVDVAAENGRHTADLVLNLSKLHKDSNTIASHCLLTLLNRNIFLISNLSVLGVIYEN